MHRLSALDAAFLYLETPDTPMHRQPDGLRASENADGLFERFVAHTAPGCRFCRAIRGA